MNKEKYSVLTVEILRLKKVLKKFLKIYKKYSNQAFGGKLDKQ